MKPRSMIRDDEASFVLGCYAFVYNNGTIVFRFTKIDGAEYVPKANFAYAIGVWKRDLGIQHRHIRDDEKGVWILPHTFEIPFRLALRSLRYAFEREGIRLDVEVVQKDEPYVVRESTLT